MWRLEIRILNFDLFHHVVYLGLVEGTKPLAVLEQQWNLLTIGTSGLAFDVLEQRPDQNTVDDKLERLGLILRDLNWFAGECRSGTAVCCCSHLRKTTRHGCGESEKEESIQ